MQQKKDGQRMEMVALVNSLKINPSCSNVQCVCYSKIPFLIPMPHYNNMIVEARMKEI